MAQDKYCKGCKHEKSCNGYTLLEFRQANKQIKTKGG